jgi:phage terminase large subunit-like protein
MKIQIMAMVLIMSYIYIYIYIWTPSFIKHPPILIIQEYLTKHPATSIIQKVYITSSKTYSQLQAEFH